MNISTRTKLLLGLSALLAALIYLVIVDLGVNAGRIHRGVMLEPFRLGGLTTDEATDALGPRGEALRSKLNIFTTDGFHCIVLPEKLGWQPRSEETAEAAFRVGRDDAPFGALYDRFRAWFGGASIDWEDDLGRRKVARFVRLCAERNEAGVGVVVDRPAFRRLVRAVALEWPDGTDTSGETPLQETYEIPLES
jgi:hypothetical protein